MPVCTTVRAMYLNNFLADLVMSRKYITLRNMLLKELSFMQQENSYKSNSSGMLDETLLGNHQSPNKNRLTLPYLRFTWIRTINECAMGVRCGATQRDTARPLFQSFPLAFGIRFDIEAWRASLSFWSWNSSRSPCHYGVCPPFLSPMERDDLLSVSWYVTYEKIYYMWPP